jgi:LuxR family maltose regulon positive regulatory protein
MEGLSQKHSSTSPERALSLAQAKMAAGEVFEAPSTSHWNAATSLPTRVRGWLFEASRHLDAGKELRAVQALERSLRLAAPEHLRRPFREASPQVRQLLRGARQLTGEHSWLGAATLDDGYPPLQPRSTARPDNRPHRPAPGPMLETLTEKEREVLGYLADLLTTDEIAGAMFVSVNTVRTHVRNILRKLDASRRNEAVRRARELEIIPGWMAVEPGKGSRTQ